MAPNTIPEEWRPVEGWPYEVSSLGRVRRAVNETAPPSQAIPGRIKTAEVHRDGRRRITLSHRSVNRHFFVARLVCEAWHGPPPTPSHQAAHTNGDPSDDRPENLRWATCRENCADTIKHGRTLRGAKNARAKLTEDDVAEIHRAYASGENQVQLGRRFGVSQAAVWYILNGRNWAHLHPSHPETFPGGTAEY